MTPCPDDAVPSAAAEASTSTATPDHFSLSLMAEHPSRSRKAAGVIDLCHLCWRQANESARIRRRPQRPRLREAA